MRVKGIKVKERALELLAWSNSEGVGLTYERIAEIIRKETGSTTGYGSIASYMSRIRTGAPGYQVAGRLPRRRDASVAAPASGNGRRKGAVAKKAAAVKVKAKAKNGRRKKVAVKAKNGRRKKTVAAKKSAAKRPVGRPKGSGVKKAAVKAKAKNGRRKGAVKRRVGRPKGSGVKKAAVKAKAKNGRRKGAVKRRVGRPKGSGRVAVKTVASVGVSRAEFRREIRGLRALLLENDRRKAAAFKELWRAWKG